MTLSMIPGTGRDRRRPPLLLLCHRIPFPPNKGDKIRSFHLLRHLGNEFEVHLGTFIDDPDDWQWQGEVERFCQSVCIRPLNPRLATLRSATGLLSGKALSLPYYTDRVLTSWVQRTVASEGIRHAVVYSAVMGQFLPAHTSIERLVVDFVDVDSDKWRQYAERKRFPMSLVYRREADRLLDAERVLAERADASLFVSAPEAALFRNLAPESAARTGYYNNGVDSGYFDPDYDAAAPEPSPHAPGARVLVFTGAMDYWPNVDAVVWFADEVLPLLRAECPELEFCIVGGNPTPDVMQLARRAGIVVTGRVPDVRPYIRHATAVVAPMRIARGIQNKVLEGMAMARPVVVSSKGLEGIEASHGNEVLVADTPEEYVAELRAVLAGERSDMGAKARALVIRDFSWEASLPRVISLILQNDGGTGVGNVGGPP